MTTADELRHAAAHWERLLAALEGDCANCGGTGRVVNSAWQVWYARSNELTRVAQVARRAAGLPPEHRVTITTDTGGFPRIDPAVAPQVEAPAVVVAAERAIDEHQNTRPHEPEQMTCAACEGYGRVLTVIGSQVADLLARHGFLRRPPSGPTPAPPQAQQPAPQGYNTGGYPMPGGHDAAYDGYNTGMQDPRAYDNGSAYDGGPYREPY